ncbi:MAG: hypothetical protein EOO81_02000 [Oxalobacteraceae bacterium]|nr:MAG: hypothetical protein EOO81_02000 [Oxalobacteraceae bacterium]
MRYAEQGDAARMEELVARGLDLSVPDAFGDCVLTRLVDELQNQPREQVLAMVKEAVRLGADPCQLDHDQDDVFGPLVGAMLYMDAALMRFLLQAGADPNALQEMGQPISLYDWACADYRLEEWDVNRLPEEPTDADLATEESWIAFFTRLAAKHGRRPPDHLAALREYGALTMKEMQALHREHSMS